MYVCTRIQYKEHPVTQYPENRNNSLRHSMKQLNLPASTISTVVDEPTVVRAILLDHTSTNGTSTLGISPSQATHILLGYNSGFRAVFIMNATLAAFATIVSVVMIRHKNLERDDDADLRAKAEKEELERAQAIASQDVTRNNSDIELVAVGVPNSTSESTKLDDKV